jgi:hypothetical protein
MAIPLRTVEVGTRPNDYFVLRTLREDNWMVAISYSGEGKVLQFQPDTAQVRYGRNEKYLARRYL